MLSGFEQWWGSLVASWGERTVLGAFAFLSYLLSWAICNIPYFYIDYYNLFTQYKLQPTIRPTREILIQKLIASIKDHFIVVLPFCIIGAPVMKWAGFRADVPLPTLFEFLLDFAIYNVLEDFLFYWTHRLFHIPYFYKRFHYIHHTYEAPYSLVGGIAHPVEFVLNFMLPFLAGPFLCASLWGTHVLTYCAWQLFREMRSTEAHSGYLLPWHMSHFLKFIGYMGAPMHDVHHRRKGMKTNFGSYVFWDLICGTYATSDDIQKKQ